MTPGFRLFLFALGFFMLLVTSYLLQPGNTATFDGVLALTGTVGLYFAIVGLVRRG